MQASGEGPLPAAGQPHSNRVIPHRKGISCVPNAKVSHPGVYPWAGGFGGPVAASAESEMPGCARRQARPLSFTYLAAAACRHPPADQRACDIGGTATRDRQRGAGLHAPIAARHRH
jgi:hypothetical protein